MGQSLTVYLLPHYWKEDEPFAFDPIKYDPQFGFEKPREEKKILATKLEMDSANLEDQSRDSCAHLKIKYRGCVVGSSPLFYKCKGLYNELGDCYYEERIHDMKEFEREKRLNARERHLRQMNP